ncbi:hypothetical protein TB2_023960 [Malus domestica]
MCNTLPICILQNQADPCSYAASSASAELLAAHNPLDPVTGQSDALVGPWWMTEEAPRMTHLSKVELKSSLDLSKIL